jgi:hypothetical protein
MKLKACPYPFPAVSSNSFVDTSRRLHTNPADSMSFGHSTPSKRSCKGGSFLAFRSGPACSFVYLRPLELVFGWTFEPFSLQPRKVPTMSVLSPLRLGRCRPWNVWLQYKSICLPVVRRHWFSAQPWPALTRSLKRLPSRLESLCPLLAQTKRSGEFEHTSMSHRADVCLDDESQVIEM